MAAHDQSLIDLTLWIWFSLTSMSVVYVAWDLIMRTPEMKVMKWGWVLVTLYIGPVAFIVYWFSCREPATGQHEKIIAPLWKQSVGSTIHCMAGDATGIIIAALVTSRLGLPMGVDAAVEYVAGFALGLLIFQALFMKDMLGGSYWNAVKVTWLPEWLSMNAVMAGMIPVMIIVMTKDIQAMEPFSLRFWGVMSMASLVGALLAYPVNWWLVKNGLKHGMGTERALGKGGTKVAEERTRVFTPAPTATGNPVRAKVDAARGVHNMGAMPDKTGITDGEKLEEPGAMKNVEVSGVRKFTVTLITLAMLAVGVTLAALYGDFLMHAGIKDGMDMPMPR